jgi:hypothetical protein
MTVGEEFQFSAGISPSNATVKYIKWISSNPVVLSIGEDEGFAKAISPGNAYVYAVAPNGNSCRTTVTVTGPGYNVPEPVDLGLTSRKRWGSFNLGATVPEEYGDYFAWGETEPKSNYTWGTYKYCNGTETSLTKYNQMPSFGSVDEKSLTSLTHSDDPCTSLSVYGWEMPSKEDFEELKSECTWKLSTQNGVKGYKITGKNGNSIFLPAAGYMNGSVLEKEGEYGYYWTRDLFANYPSRANYLYFNDSNVTLNLGSRMSGYTVRPTAIIITL